MLDNYPSVQPGPPRPSTIIQPQIFSMPPGTERYEVAGSGAVLIPVFTGDRINITNDEGGQICEVVAADDSGIDAGLVGMKGDMPADGLKSLLTSDDQSLRGLRMGLDARGIDLGQSGAFGLFGATSPAKDSVEMTARRDGVLIIAAPGGQMDFEAQNTTTPLTVMVTRAKIKSHVRFELPVPLADPSAEIRLSILDIHTRL